MTLTQQQAEWSVLKDAALSRIPYAETPEMRRTLENTVELAEEMESRMRVARRKELYAHP